MSDDKTIKDAEDALLSDTITATFTLGGETYPMKIRDITIEEMNERMEQEEDTEDELAARKALVDDYLVKPEVDLNTPRKVNAVFFGMVTAWQGGEDMQKALEDLQIPDQGNG